MGTAHFLPKLANSNSISTEIDTLVLNFNSAQLHLLCMPQMCLTHALKIFPAFKCLCFYATREESIIPDAENSFKIVLFPFVPIRLLRDVIMLCQPEW